MLLLLSFCSFPWWLAWLLPFLLGLLLGWSLWSKWQKMYNDLKGSSSKFTSRISSLENENKKFQSDRTKYESKISKLEKSLKEAKAQATRKQSTPTTTQTVVTGLAATGAAAAAASNVTQGIDIKALKADLNVLEDKRKQLEGRVMNLTEERNDWRSKYESVKEQYDRSQAESEAQDIEPTEVIGDDWEAKYNNALELSKRKDDLLSAKDNEIKRIKERFSDVDRKITTAEREATQWKIKYNALKQNASNPDLENAVAGIAPASFLVSTPEKTTAEDESTSIEEIATLPDEIEEVATLPEEVEEVATLPEETKETVQETIEEVATLPEEAADTVAEVTEDITDAAKSGIAGVATSIAAAAGLSEQEETPVSKPSSIYSNIEDDNLQIIEGIGPKMETVLKEHGIEDFETLASKTTADVQGVLDSHGDKYRIIDPSSWVKQATMAKNHQWKELIDFQKDLNSSSTEGAEAATSDSKLEKFLIKKGFLKKWNQDDLKAIEGIGPAIERTLKESGINTWKELSESTPERIKEILSAAGPKFQLADPTTWAKQAKMAHEGRFQELQDYQDILDGGKE